MGLLLEKQSDTSLLCLLLLVVGRIQRAEVLGVGLSVGAGLSVHLTPVFSDSGYSGRSQSVTWQKHLPPAILPAWLVFGGLWDDFLFNGRRLRSGRRRGQGSWENRAKSHGADQGFSFLVMKMDTKALRMHACSRSSFPSGSAQPLGQCFSTRERFG